MPAPAGLAGVFGAILDRSAGGFRLGPEGVAVPSARRYLPGTMVLETSWGTPTGWLMVRDALLMGPWHHDIELSNTHRRTPTDYDADHVLLRTIRCVTGEMQVTFDCEPVFDYGRLPGTWEDTDRGYAQAVCRPASPDAGLPLTLTTDMRVGFEGGRAMARTLMREGEHHFVALSWTVHQPPFSYEEAQRGAQAALARGEATLAKTWREAADEIREDISAHGVDDRGVFTQHYQTRALDASLLLLPMTGFLPHEDPRVRATILAIADELTEEGLVLRYRPEETDDGLPGGEGTFTICSFLLVSALCEIGAADRAQQLASGCCRWPARWTCTPRRSTRGPAASWAISRRRSPTWP